MIGIEDRGLVEGRKIPQGAQGLIIGRALHPCERQMGSESLFLPLESDPFTFILYPSCEISQLREPLVDAVIDHAGFFEIRESADASPSSCGMIPSRMPHVSPHRE